MKSTTHLILGMLALASGMEAKAQIQLPSVFSDGMVLQQNSKVAVWGWGNPSETLMILSGWNPGDTVRTVVDNQGRWKAEVPTGRAGGPYTLEVKGGNDSRKVSDVMLGEVWLCSGHIIRKSKFPQNPKRSVRFSGKRTKRSVQKRKARNTQKAETKVL